MKRIVLGAAAAGGAAVALHHLARKGRAMHDYCRELMRNQCATSSAPRRSA